MSSSNSVTSWTTLSPERRRHIQLALVGTALSWALAASMALVDADGKPPAYPDMQAGAQGGKHATLADFTMPKSPVTAASASR